MSHFKTEQGDGYASVAPVKICSYSLCGIKIILEKIVFWSTKKIIRLPKELLEYHGMKQVAKIVSSDDVF
jgi:hypothetical protein